MTSVPINFMYTHGQETEPYKFCFIFNYCLFVSTGCLQSFVTDIDKNGPLLFDKVVDFSYQLFSALDFLHSSLKILHRDIKRM